jgi:hypothetical protein
MLEKTNWMNRPYIEFLSEVDRLLEKQFGITTADAGQSGIASSQEAGESPQDHVDWLAEHFDLEPLPK